MFYRFRQLVLFRMIHREFLSLKGCNNLGRLGYTSGRVGFYLLAGPRQHHHGGTKNHEAES
jgi:hypothetical protein